MENKLCPLRKRVTNYCDVRSCGRSIDTLQGVPVDDTEFTEETFFTLYKRKVYVL